MADLFVLGFLAHLVADWFFQSDAMAQNKTNLRHSAAWWHAVIHWTALYNTWWLIGGLDQVACGCATLAVVASHMLIDTRKPLVWWRKVYGIKQVDPLKSEGSTFNQIALHVAMWQDQAAHLIVLGIASIILTRFA